MKILITTDLYTTETNGVVTSVKNLSEELIARGHEVRILTVADGWHSCQIGNVYYIRSVPLGVIYPDVRMPTSYHHHRLIKELIQWGPQVIHSQCEFFSFQFASYISKKTGAPIVHTYHTLYEQYAPYVLPIKGVGEKAVGTLSKFRLKNVQRVIAPTRKVEDTLRSYGVAAPISVVPSGIRLEQHSKRLDVSERSAGRAQLGISDEDLVLLNIGRLGNEKNLDELVRYFADVLPEYENLKFLIVGDGPAREMLEKLTDELGLREYVIFTGMVPPTQVQEYYQLGDIFVSASTSETQGLTYIEAAANGLPLLCRQDPCLRDVMVSGENGYDYTDVEGFRQALRAIAADLRWREAASERSRQIAASFGKDAFGSAVEDIYQDLLQNDNEEEVNA
ncbi:MAG: glycosyltransferase [Oscillospiraceae bacterium]|nr:glycosyltransferase [Oscillospiraceae bacterium]